MLARALRWRAWCHGPMGRQHDDDQRPDSPRPGLVGVLWCVAAILAVLVIGVAMGMLDGG